MHAWERGQLALAWERGQLALAWEATQAGRPHSQAPRRAGHARLGTGAACPRLG